MGKWRNKYSFRELTLCYFNSPDVGGIQVCSHSETSSQGEASHDAALCSEASQGADKVFGATVEEEQHEDHVSNIPESAASPQ